MHGFNLSNLKSWRGKGVFVRNYILVKERILLNLFLKVLIHGFETG